MHDVAGVAGQRVLAPEAPEHRPGERQQDEHERQADEQELDEAHGLPHALEEAGELAVRRRADLGPDAAQVRAVGDRQHDRHAVVAQSRAAPRFELGDQGEADRHHHGGGRGVGDPERDEGGRREDAGEEPPRVGADPLHDAEREPAMEVPLLHRRRDRHAAGEEEDVRVEIGRERGGEAGRAFVTEDPEQRKEDDRQTGGPVDRYRLGQPPDRHQRRDRRRHRRSRTHLRLTVERRVDEGEEGSGDEADGDRQRLEARWSGVLGSHGARSLSRRRPPDVASH